MQLVDVNGVSVPVGREPRSCGTSVDRCIPNVASSQLRYPGQRSSATQFQARIRECRDRNLEDGCGRSDYAAQHCFIDVGVIRMAVGPTPFKHLLECIHGDRQQLGLTSTGWTFELVTYNRKRTQTETNKRAPQSKRACSTFSFDRRWG